MDFTGIRKLLLKFFIGFLVLTALIAIVVVFSNEFGDLQQRILATTFTISIGSICAMSCAAFIERKKMVTLGLTGFITSAITAFLLILLIWSSMEDKFWVKLIGSLITASFAFAHAFLLALPELEKQYKWVQSVTAVSIFILAVQIIIAIWMELEDITYFRIMAAVGIMVGLETLTIPILMKLKTDDESSKKQRLELTKMENGLFRDSSGNVYRVDEVEVDEDTDDVAT